VTAVILGVRHHVCGSSTFCGRRSDNKSRTEAAMCYWGRAVERMALERLRLGFGGVARAVPVASNWALAGYKSGATLVLMACPRSTSRLTPRPGEICNNFARSNAERLSRSAEGVRLV
jgi:hypothetical protein